MEGDHPLEGTAWVLTESSLSSQDLGSQGITADFFEEQMSGQGAGEQLLRRVLHRG